MAILLSCKFRGLTAADATLGTQSIEFHDDGSLRFADAAGNKHRFMPSGSVAALLKLAFTGPGGFPATKKWFGCP